MPAPSTTPSDAATQHPFPTTPPPKLPGDDSSSSSSNDDPDATPPAGDDTVHPTRHKLPKVKKVQTDDERVDEDIYVAKFYMNDENYQGAYLRAKDAVSVQPDYSLAHFTLAQVAAKLKKKDEAIAEYQLYLKLDPTGEKAKAAKQALAELK
jgi:tetratricopeptide (TPR) repeat protein